MMTAVHKKKLKRGFGSLTKELPILLPATIDGTFAETAIVDYHLSFADQGKQTFIFGFHLQQTNINCRFPLVPFFIDICCNFKRKMENESPNNFP
jgi:hypothetical protein